MTVIGWIQILLYCAIVVAIVPFLGAYMTRVFSGERTFLSPVLRPVEAALYWAGGVDEKREQHWLTYTIAMLFFHVGGFLILPPLSPRFSSPPLHTRSRFPAPHFSSAPLRPALVPPPAVCAACVASSLWSSLLCGWVCGLRVDAHAGGAAIQSGRAIGCGA